MNNKNDGSIWQSRPVFITSTFRDMHAERDHLRNVVFPELAERLRERRHHLEPIDLRWGVETVGEKDEQAKQLLVLKVCLNEVERSRPFLIGLLGDRYGWIPPEERMRAAAREAGFDKEVAGRSVTDLEIDFGVLSSREQRRRCFFYFREPLPYAEMQPETAALYSDAHSSEMDGPAAVDKLAALKSRIETTLPDRVRHYQVGWDSKKERITDLDAWGQQVLQDIWSELDVATADIAGEAGTSWQAVERFTLEQFLEERGRGFVGREDILKDLTTLALSQAEEDEVWGRCVVGAPGAGKSALYAALHSQLQGQDVLLLSHAAGISARSGQVDALLRRWIEELADFLQVTDPIADDASAEDVDETFRSLLSRASTQRRVVVLIDALNQFEPTTRAEHLTWLPKPWPANARLIATAITGSASEALAARPGTTASELSPLSEAEAGEIVTSICKRYHRELNPEVLAALLAKKRTDNDLACGNPLWLEIAVEELNLLDADAFERAEHDFTGTAEEQLHQLLMTTVEQMPGDVSSLYAWMLVRAEKLHGEAWTRAFTTAAQASRAGWRESDLQVLMPSLSGEEWQPLRFAALRRSFRAHVVQRGSHNQWEFTHRQMRIAVEDRYLTDPDEFQALQLRIADHLLKLPANDPLHQTETMVHLIRADDSQRAAEYYAGELTQPEISGATQALSDYIVASESLDDGSSGIDWTVSMLQCGEHDGDLQAFLGRRFVFDLHDSLWNHVRLDTRLELIESAGISLQEVADRNPANADWLHVLSVHHNKLGDALVAQGDGEGAEQAYSAALEIRHGLAGERSDNSSVMRALSLSQIKMGDMYVAKGESRQAEQAYRASHGILETLVNTDPHNSEWQRELSVSHNKLGDVLGALGDIKGAEQAYLSGFNAIKALADRDSDNTQWQDDLSVSYGRLGDVLASLGDAEGAEHAYRSSLEVAEPLTQGDPANTQWQHGVSVSYEKLGDLATARGDGEEAAQAFATSLDIRGGLVAADPGNTHWQRDLAVSYQRLGNSHSAQGNGDDAEQAYRAALAIDESLARSDPNNATWQKGLSISYGDLGNVLRARGDSKGAEEALRAALEIIRNLANSDPDNEQLQYQLAVCHGRLGKLLEAQGDNERATRAYRDALAIDESLVRKSPNIVQWQHGLAVDHLNLGDALISQGDSAGAERAYREGLAIVVTLARDNPKDTRWQLSLSVSHGKLGHLLRSKGDIAGAANAFRAALAVDKILARSDPENTEWQRSLSVSYTNIGDVLTTKGDGKGAENAYRAGLAISEVLSQSDPANTLWQLDMSTSLDRLGKTLAAKGDNNGAEKAYRAGLTIRDALARNDSRNTELQRALSVSHFNLGDSLATAGRADDAKDAYQSGLAVVASLVRSDPGNAQWQYDLSVCRSQFGDSLAAQGDSSGAEQEYRAALSIRETLAHLDRTNPRRHRSLSSSYNKLGDVLAAQGDYGGADEAYRSGLAIMDSLARAYPDKIQWQIILAACHVNLGDMLAGQQKYKDAEKAYGDGIVVTELLTSSEPENTQFQRDLSMTNVKLGDTLADKGDDKGAAKAYRVGLDIAGPLASEAPDDIGWQYGVWLNYVKLGYVLRAESDSEDAENAYRAALSISQPSARRYSDDPNWHHAVRISHERLGLHLFAESLNLERAGQSTRARKQMEEAVEHSQHAVAALDRQQHPKEWAERQTQVGAALVELARWATGIEALGDAESAILAALEELSPKDESDQWAINHFNLGQTHHLLGERSKNMSALVKALSELEIAVSAFQHAGSKDACQTTEEEILLVRQSIEALEHD